MKKVTMEDMDQYRFLSQLSYSPDGSRAAFVVSQTSIPENRYVADIWLLEKGSPRQLTKTGNVRSFLWLDEEHILFPDSSKKTTADTPGQDSTTFCILDVCSGKTEEYFTVQAKVNAIRKAGTKVFLLTATVDYNVPDIAALDEDQQAEIAIKLEEEKDYEVFDELPFWFNGKGIVNKKRTRLYRFELDSRALLPISPPYMNVSDFDYDRDTDRVLYYGSDYQWVDQRKDDMYICSLHALEQVQIKLERRFTVNSALFLDGRVVFAASDGIPHGTAQNHRQFSANPGTGEIEPLAELDMGMGSSVASDCRYGEGRTRKAADGKWYFLATIGSSSYIVRLDAQGRHTVVSPPISGSIDCFDYQKGEFIYVAMRKCGLQEVYTCREEAETEEKCTGFNDEYLLSHAVAEPVPLHVTSIDGSQIDGWVLPPTKLEPSRKYPAILDVHGGPKTVYGEVFYHEMQIWASQGYFVFYCNPHGSDGKGSEFADIRGEKYGVLDYSDIMTFTDQVLEQYPQIDLSRVGMTGGSYGGFMANWIIGHTDRFRAVVSQRSISNFISKCLTTDIGYYHNLDAVQADPWRNPEIMWDHSPLKYADKCKTPTLFIHSDEDYRCWMGDAIQMFTALRMHGCPTRLCLIHGENHALSRAGKPKHRLRRLKEIADWFEKYLVE